MKEDSPRPFGLPAAVLKWRRGKCRASGRE
jgi:hypothetical protein